MIGIAMSTYQNEAIIEETIRSLQAQASPFRCIIADDGSTDQTVETIRRLTQHDERFEVIALPHGERGIARKTAIDRLKALDVEYLYIIDSDMVLSDDLLEELSVVPRSPSGYRSTCHPGTGIQRPFEFFQPGQSVRTEPV